MSAFADCYIGWIPGYPGILKESGACSPRAASLLAGRYTSQAEFILPSVYIAFPEVFYLEISNTSVNTNIDVLKKIQ